ncbi:MAG: type II toxin-antitoxin system ParD family antitoxin [Pseudomonadota bacterium]
MGKVEKISVSLTEELLADVQQAVATGDYASTSEVVREALRDWKEQKVKKDAAIAELRALIAEGDASGYIEGPLDVEGIITRGRERLKSD